jgi:putative transposase
MSTVQLRYPSDMSDIEWERVCREIPPSPPIGADRTVDLREVVNAIFYIVRSGCSWRMLPKDFPPWQTVYGYLRRWKLDGTWQQIHDALREEIRQRDGREASPSAAIIDSQSVKTTEKGGFAGKKVSGRKRHILVDTLGLLLTVVVHAASIQDRDGAKLVFEKARGLFPRLKLVWADGGYAGQLVGWVQPTCGWLLEIVKRNADMIGFQVLPRRWVVERTFAWLGRFRRKSKDYEELTDTSETMIQIAMIRLMLGRIQTAYA